MNNEDIKYLAGAGSVKDVENLLRVYGKQMNFDGSKGIDLVRQAVAGCDQPARSQKESCITDYLAGKGVFAQSPSVAAKFSEAAASSGQHPLAYGARTGTQEDLRQLLETYGDKTTLETRSGRCIDLILEGVRAVSDPEEKRQKMSLVLAYEALRVSKAAPYSAVAATGAGRLRETVMPLFPMRDEMHHGRI